MQLPKNYYHCFLGNGTDAVLIGPTGSMTSDKFSVDRGNWYKSDRYYPEDKLVMVAGRFPVDKKLEHAEGSGWYDAAPIGRTWYTLLDGESRLELQNTDQKFVPQEGTLYSKVDYGTVKGEVETWLHATKSVLIERYTFDKEVDFQAWIGAGVWVDDVWDTDPFYSVDMADDAAEGHYDLGETEGVFALRLDPAPTGFGKEGRDRRVSVRGKTITKYFMISDNRQGALDPKLIDKLIASGYDALRTEHLKFWSDYFAISSISIPDATFQYFYDASMYHFKAMQSVVSGGIPVNNLRRTWSSHIFWDSYFMQRAQLEANHKHEALEACRFFQRTLPQAERHAREEFGSEGIKWDWEITHDGRKAYGTLLHMKFQVHNNGSYANEIMGYYQYTQDKAYLAEFYPILRGLATFFMKSIVEKTERGYEIGYLVGVHESPVKVRNDGINLTGTIAILRHCANAAKILGLEDAFTAECLVVADELMKIMDSLYNGKFFKASDDQEHINMSSIGPIFPMSVIKPMDPRAISTADAYMDLYGGRQIGDGNHSNSKRAFPWSAGVLGAILAWQNRGDFVWEVIQAAEPSMCTFGGMTEVMENGEWNMQYFGTAQGAVCIAIHQMLLQVQNGHIELFPALPSAWETASFDNLLAEGLSVTAKWTKDSVECTLRNDANVPLTRDILYGKQPITVELAPGAERTVTWAS
ncbi:MAG: hypothetical protein LCI00_07065 [Chloroflexi bacterium]|nr:hypothetical protein [Chloroflexota bacterium]MCC6891646.1 hypothetical protein [Anaerolineae bacterium]